MKMKRIISIILMLCMVLTALPVGAFASEGGEDVGYIGAPGIDSLAIVGSNIPGVAEWNPSDPAGDMELVADYVYQKKLTLVAGAAMTFKIAGNDIWDDTCNFGSASIVLGEEAELKCGSGSSNMSFTATKDMTIKITVDLTTFVNGGAATILVKEAACEDLVHNWADATCAAPKTCSLCGITEGEPVPENHTWSDATCTAPKTCALCGTAEGEALGHSYENGVCATCGEVPLLNNGMYELYNATQLYWFAAQVNSGNTFINGKLMADIVVNENVLTADGKLNGGGSNFRIWTPITNFGGTFDGNGKTISGLYYTGDSEDIGLFGFVTGTGVVKGVKLEDSWFSGNAQYSYGKDKGTCGIGGIASYNRGSVKDCTVSASISGTNYRSGGIVGYNDDGTVENCVFNGNASGNSEVGGVVGYNVAGTVNGCTNTGGVNGNGGNTGGIVGYNNSIIIDCSNSGNVNGDNYIGGVTGYNYNGTVTNCSNSGSVSGKDRIGGVAGYNDGMVGNCHNTGSINGTNRIGGVIGFNVGTVSNCYNTGNVGGNYHVGGVVGYNNYGKAINCYNTGSVNGNSRVGGVVGYNDGTVGNCYNTGSINGSDYIGGVAGYYGYGEVTNCYTLENACVNAGYGTVKTAEQFAYGEVAWLLQGDQTELVWGQSLGIDSVPVLGGAPVYQVVTCDGAGTGYANDPNAVLGHKYLSTKYEATCLEQGMSVHTCLWCRYCYIDNQTPALGHSIYINGFCQACDGYEPAVRNGDVYEIYNAGHLYWFSQWVQFGNTAINGKLMADIVVNENVLTADGQLNGDGSKFRVWMPIGNDSRRYTGTFDGNGKTIFGLYCPHAYNRVGLFGSIGTGGLVQNVGIVDTYFTGEWIGCISAFNYGTISSCYNAGTIGHGYAGGLVAENNGIIVNSYNIGTVNGRNYIGGVAGRNYGVIVNSYNTGDVIGGNQVGGLAGWNTGTISNSYNTGNVRGDYYTGGISGYNNGYLSGCYYLTGCAVDSMNMGQFGVGAVKAGEFSRDKQNQTSAKTMDQFASGEVVYLLNDSQSERAWGQTIGVDAYPILDGSKVYKNLIGGCTSTSFVYDYANLEADPVVTHRWAETVCTAHKTCADCGLIEAETQGNGVYEVSVAPSVDATGALISICDACANTITVTLPMLNTADYTYTVKQEPTGATVGVGRYTWNTTDYGTFYFDVEIEVEESVEILQGDVDGNGVIDTTDYMRVKAAFLGTFELSEGEFISADVDKNGIIDTTDYMRIKAHFLGTYVIE